VQKLVVVLIQTAYENRSLLKQDDDSKATDLTDSIKSAYSPITRCFFKCKACPIHARFIPYVSYIYLFSCSLDEV